LRLLCLLCQQRLALTVLALQSQPHQLSQQEPCGGSTCTAASAGTRMALGL
jgi:hypothetical protein